MKNLPNLIHRDTFNNDQKIEEIIRNAKDIIPVQTPNRGSLSSTIRQQWFFLPYYAFLFQILLCIIQLSLLNGSSPVQVSIIIVSILQLSLTLIMASRSTIFKMEELEQVTRCGQQQLFLIHYILLGFLLYIGLCLLTLISCLTGNLIFIKTSLLICTIYHLTSVLILYILSKVLTRNSYQVTTISIILGLSIFVITSLMGVIKQLLQFSSLTLIFLTIISAIVFYVFCNQNIRKEHTSCN